MATVPRLPLPTLDLTFHVVQLFQLDPTEVGHSPQGDVQALGHMDLEAVKAYLELGRYRYEPGGPGASAHPPWPGQLHLAQLEPRLWKQRRRGTHSLGLGWQSPRTGCGQVSGSGGQTSRPGTDVLQRLGSDPCLTCCPRCSWREALGTRTVRQCVSCVSRLMEQASRPRRLSGGGRGQG